MSPLHAAPSVGMRGAQKAEPNEIHVEHSERDEATTDLTAYLLFHPSFCRRLMELGREGVVASRDEIQSFFAGGRSPLPAPAR